MDEGFSLCWIRAIRVIHGQDFPTLLHVIDFHQAYSRSISDTAHDRGALSPVTLGVVWSFEFSGEGNRVSKTTTSKAKRRNPGGVSDPALQKKASLLLHVIDLDETDACAAVLSRQDGGESAGW